MKFFAVQRSDGGASVLQVVDGADPQVVLAQYAFSWRQKHERKTARGEPSVLWEPVSMTEITDFPDRTFRDAWRVADGKLEIDPIKKAEIESRPPRQTIGQRIAALERR